MRGRRQGGREEGRRVPRAARKAADWAARARCLAVMVFNPAHKEQHNSTEMAASQSLLPTHSDTPLCLTNMARTASYVGASWRAHGCTGGVTPRGENKGPGWHRDQETACVCMCERASECARLHARAQHKRGLPAR